VCTLFVRSGIRTLLVSLRRQYEHNIGGVTKYLLRALAKTSSSISHAFGYILNLRIDVTTVLDVKKDPNYSAAAEDRYARTLLRVQLPLHSRN
jgi:hypothetical protein